MMVTERLLSVGETALVLGIALGADKQWSDALNDMRLGRSGINGVESLLPAARVKERCQVPKYRPADVLWFIKSVRRVFKSDRPFGSHPTLYTFQIIDPVNRCIHWKMQHATPSHP